MIYSKIPEYVKNKKYKTPYTSDIQSQDIIDRMRVAGKLAAKTLEHIAQHIKIGVSTEYLDKIAYQYIIANDAYPSPLQYKGFPKSICTSINDVICHGIPSKNDILHDGDIINIDVTVYYQGVHGDTNATYFVGNVSQNIRDLVNNTKIALYKAIDIVKPGRPISLIGKVIEGFANRFNYGVVRDFTGHGINTVFHSNLIIPHYYDSSYDNIIIKEGMTFTIEPMLNLGSADYKMLKDGWTVKTADKQCSAQFEHTLLVEQNKAVILTE